MKSLNRNTALLIIDIQKGFDDKIYWGGNRNNPQAEENAKKILDVFREKKLPVFIIQHCSKDPDSLLHESNQGNALKDDFIPLENEFLIKKSVNSSFIGTNLKEHLDQLSIENTVILGLTTVHCVSTTTRMSGNFGFNTYLIEDACATFDRTDPNGKIYSAQELHDMELACLNNEFAKVISTLELIKILEQ
ncbi:cysteine hydrolase family protein [Chryseobacterium sp.]|uniref:cysteine hydrolase family protein n=1 Tax=Chryseobacterium sp. TaxID=1871047 RepID=UPI0025C3289B|nr:cysteine hydrolase family protein [Chryseobacterium sp.]